MSDKLERNHCREALLKAENALLKKALEFYANMSPMDFQRDLIHYANPSAGYSSVVGKKARETLRALNDR